MSEAPTGRRRLVLPILAGTVVAFLVRGAEYALIGSYMPLALIAVVLGLLVLARVIGPSSFTWSVRAWSIVLVGYGAIRVCLGILFATPLLSHEAHLSGHFTMSYMVFSAAYLLAGLYLLRHVKSLRPG